MRPFHKLKRARPESSRARARTGTRYPPALERKRSVVVDVDVDLVGDVDGGLAPAQAELAAEEEQENQNDDDQQDYGKDAASAATAGFDHGRTLVFGAVIV